MAEAAGGRDAGPDVAWQGRVPRSLRFGDGYYASGDGLAESRHVFLAGNGLPERFRPGFAIAELGFGTGLNALAALQAWRASAIPGALGYTAFEAFPMTAHDMARALGAWPDLAPLAEPLVAAWAAAADGGAAGGPAGATADGAARRIDLPGMALTLVIGDARATVPAWTGAADAWFLDGFAPARNPELWEAGLIAAVAARTAPGGTVATYSAAGTVRRRLAAAGFAVERVAGFGRKRHMTRAVRTG